MSPSLPQLKPPRMSNRAHMMVPFGKPGSCGDCCSGLRGGHGLRSECARAAASPLSPGGRDQQENESDSCRCCGQAAAHPENHSARVFLGWVRSVKKSKHGVCCHARAPGLGLLRGLCFSEASSISTSFGNVEGKQGHLSCHPHLCSPPATEP